MKGEMTEVAIIVAPCGKCATSGAASQSYSALEPGKKPRTMATAITARADLTSRLRSSIRCATKGCSVPASSSSGASGSGLLAWFMKAKAASGPPLESVWTVCSSG